jgi:hypothetical protein
MDILGAILTIVGLALFETVSSIDNAVINAEVLTTMSAKARRWFLTWGIFFAVFLVRGLLPLLIFWMGNPQLSIIQVFTAMFSSDPALAASVEASAPPLLVGGGLFLVLLFVHWLFMEEKNYGLRGEKFFHKHGLWFYSVASIILLVVVWLSVGHSHPKMAIGATIGAVAFFVTSGFKENAEQAEKKMMSGMGMSDVSKLLYLEVIDATFSIDGVLGAFAFTLAVPLILIGNGIGAIVVRQITVSNIETVKKYKYLKNGAMYSIVVLGIIMIADAFGAHIPEWLSPIATIGIIGWFFWKSRKEYKQEQKDSTIKSKKSSKKSAKKNK